MTTCSTLLRRFTKQNHQCVRCVQKLSNQTPTRYCLDLVRKHDYENFLCTLLLPDHLRSAAFAIRAFNTEIALVEDHVTDQKIGLMRLKFWEEALNEIYNGKPLKNPASSELYRVLQKNKLSKQYFKRLVEARFNKLQSATFMNLESLEKYADNTVSSVYYLLLEAHGVKDINTDHYASHLGKAHGIITLIRAIPYNAQRRVIDLPQDILMKHSVSSESVLRGKCSKEFKDVIFDTAARAKQHLDKANSMENRIKKEARIIFLPSLIVSDYLEKLRRSDFDVFDPKLQRRNHLLPLKLYWKKIFC
ncbi:hypothetical protein QAD02_016833 [Eretmocerus hayati]|uniref:Uncharacterized protein n=1 Tax=Eretmocerus hayati TaxID=131215 RepID=A0ACC2PDH3_9HYME|nr:hypothetical protein QAD02_016833 [Eretmocerus hayati]